MDEDDQLYGSPEGSEGEEEVQIINDRYKPGENPNAELVITKLTKDQGGEKPKAGAEILVNYVEKLKDGTVVGSTTEEDENGDTIWWPRWFTLGVGEVI